MIVVDTNLLVYLFVGGSRTAEAEAVFKRDGAWAAPWLWRSEFRNVMIGIVRQRDLLLDDAVRLAEEAERWMEGREYTVPTTKVLHLAAVSGCSAYDCEFIAVAEDLRVPLITVDQQLLKAFPSIAMPPKAFAIERST